MTTKVDRAIAHNNTNYFLTFCEQNKDPRHQIFSFLTPEELSKFSLTSKKCSEFVRIYNPIGRCTSILNFASVLIPTWEKPQPKQSTITVIGRHLLNGASSMLPGLLSRALATPAPPISKRDQLANKDTVRGQLSFVFSPSFHSQPKPLVFRDELLKTLGIAENSVAGEANHRQMQKINALYNIISDSNLRSHYEKLSIIIFTILDNIFYKMTVPGGPRDRTRLTAFVKELRERGVQQVGSDFQNEILETAIYSILSQFYLVNLTRKDVREAEGDLKQLIRFLIPTIGPDAGKDLEQTTRDLASTIDKTFKELEPLFNTALNIAKGQGNGNYEKGIITRRADNNTEAILTIFASILIFYNFKSGSNDLVAKIINFIDFDQAKRGYAHPDFVWFFTALIPSVLLSFIPKTIHTFFPPKIVLIDMDDRRITTETFSKPEVLMRITLVLTNALAVGYLGLRCLGIL